MSTPALGIEYLQQPGGSGHQQKQSFQGKKWSGIGIVYVSDEGDFRVLYESHVSQEVKDKIASTFGVGALEWQVCR